MRVSGFTIIRNGLKLQYPFIESINSILPICDEFIVAVGDSDDGTLEAIRSIRSPKIKIVETIWDMSRHEFVLADQTNIALSHCTGDWAFYLQTDEVVHEDDLPKLVTLMKRYQDDSAVDAIRFRWLHFYGSHYRYRIDKGWYQKQDRIIKNNGKIRSCGDAFSFERIDQQPLRVINSGCFMYHYGWVFTQEQMAKRRLNQATIWQGIDRDKEKLTGRYEFGDLQRFPIYFGSHPEVMEALINAHPISNLDKEKINQQFWWHPFWIWRVRYKTGRRVKVKLE